MCIDPSFDALRIAKRNAPNCHFMLSAAGELALRPDSMDFGLSLGVLHHTPDPLSALTDVVATLKPGAPFLGYVYYAFDNRPRWFKVVWRGTDLARRAISRAPNFARYAISQVIALLVYFPIARLSAVLEGRGRQVESIPLSAYRHRSFYSMRTDALDRFGTRLEKRFTRREVGALFNDAGLERVVVGEEEPFWCAVGFKRSGLA